MSVTSEHTLHTHTHTHTHTVAMAVVEKEAKRGDLNGDGKLDFKEYMVSETCGETCGETPSEEAKQWVVTPWAMVGEWASGRVGEGVLRVDGVSE